MSEYLLQMKNVNTGEIIKFESKKDAADYLSDVYNKKIHESIVSGVIKRGKPYKNTWDINLIEGGDIRVCEYCGKEYKRKNKKQRFCSNYCKEQYIVVQRTKDTPLVAMKNKDKEILVHKLVTMLAPYRTAK